MPSGICNRRCDLARSTLLPALRRQAEVNLLHGDAPLDRADKRAEIAANALGFVHPRNPGQRRCIGAVLRTLRVIELGNRGYSDRRAASSFYLRRFFVQLHMS